jgi:hypothetical protein
MSDYVPDKVHLVGSVALDSVQEVFATAGSVLGARLARIPDGEPGGRRLWISWQYPLLRANAYLVPNPDPDTRGAAGSVPLQLDDGVRPDEVQFGELGYAREARASYLDFLAARKAGHIAATTRFQVCLPTPLAVIGAFCRGKDMLTIEAAYEKAMIREVQAIVAAIPHQDLCLQWDICNEMVMWDGQFPRITPPVFKDVKTEVMTRITRLIATVPADVELGVHLCYGDLDAKHFVEPQDAGKMTEFANAIAAAAQRDLAYIHMPVPIARDDDDFYRPLTGLRLKPGTELYLGLVHQDGAQNTKRRIATARKYVSSFGIGTECGIARKRRPDLVRSILKIHAESSAAPRPA